jgi:hypothetical protein
MTNKTNFHDKIAKFILCRDRKLPDFLYEILVIDVLPNQIQVVSLRPADKFSVYLLSIEDIEFIEELDETAYMTDPNIALTLQIIQKKPQIQAAEFAVDTSKLALVDRKTLIAATRVDAKHKNEKFRDCYYAADIEAVKQKYGFKSGSEIVYFLLGRLAWWCKKEKHSIRDIILLSPLLNYNKKWLKKPRLLDAAIEKVCMQTKTTARFRLNGTGKFKQDPLERLKKYIQEREKVTYEQIQNAFRDIKSSELQRILSNWVWKENILGQEYFGKGTKLVKYYYWKKQ